jgi:predicted peptidase
MEKRNFPFTWIDWLLLLAIASSSVQLLVMLLGPVTEACQNRPRPGMQVSRQYLVKQGTGADAVTIPINYLLYVPSEYAETSKWPLVVYLHGAGSQGHDLNLVRREGLPGLIGQGTKFRFILLSPQHPRGSWWIPELVVGLIEHISSSLPVDRNRVYLTGYSMGGNGTWAVASYDPSRFAAIAPLCGRGNVSQAERLAKMPIWAFHGAKDQVIPLRASEAMVDAVRKSGGHVKFTVYPDAGHGICEETYQNPQLYELLLAQRRGRPQESHISSRRTTHK